MKKQNSILLFQLFIVLFSAFLVAMINYWNSNMIHVETSNEQNLTLKISSIFLVVFCSLCWLLFYKKKKGINIHSICQCWCIIMPVVIVQSLSMSGIGSLFSTILWPLLFEMGFLFSKQISNSVKSFRRLFLLIGIWGIFLLFSHKAVHNTQSNTIYFSLLTLPWWLVLKGGKYQSFVLVVFTILAIFSLKRSSMLAIVLCWTIYVILKFKLKKSKLIGVVSIMAVLIVGTIIFTVADDKLGGQLTERVNREETAEGRNRLGIYILTMEMILSSSSQELLLGHGHFAVKKNSIFNVSAHNDFLEVIYDYGLIILVLYLCLWIYVFRKCISLYKQKSELLFPYAVSLCIFLVLSNVSHLILYTSYFNFLVLFWGCVEGYCEKKNKLKMILNENRIIDIS